MFVQRVQVCILGLAFISHRKRGKSLAAFLLMYRLLITYRELFRVEDCCGAVDWVWREYGSCLDDATTDYKKHKHDWSAAHPEAPGSLWREKTQ